MSQESKFLTVALMLGVGLVLALAATAVASTVTTTSRSAESSPARTGFYVETSGELQVAPRESNLDGDLDMTRFMSQAEGAWAPMTEGQHQNGQLERSRDPAYVRQLEQRQAEMDLMLATPQR